MIPLLVDLETEWRGGQNQALLLLLGLHARGHAAELVAARGSALGERVASSGVSVHSVSRGGFRIPAARRIRALLGSGRFAIVHANEAHALTAAWLARAHQRVPLIVSRHVGYPLGKSRLARARFEAAARIVANSRWVADQAVASGAPIRKVTVVYDAAEIPSPVTPEQRLAARAQWGVAPDAPLLGCVGVLLPDKGQERLIRALAGLRDEFPQIRLLLAGDGPCRPHLEALARELGVAEAIIFAGFVKEIEMVYRALDVFLFPAQFEGLGSSLLSAMAHEVPSVALNRCAFGEIIENEQSGLLIETATPGELQNAAARLLRTPEFARKLGRAGRHRIAERFSTDRMVEGMICVYEESLLGGRASRNS